MTKLLYEAFARAGELAEEDQNAFARWVLNELTQEKRWAELIEAGSDELTDLAAEALEEHRRGETEPLDPAAL